ncbi:hypothetical protein EDD85DRAFT_235081 [Armillaria nabsnona]|nr:hypothetical protein EDD85DRAFT_235081 [Armillaria nabsnona]
MGVERLSFDALGDIFTGVREAIDPQGEHDTIILLASVCSTWCYTALAYPKLWSYIYLPMLSRSNSSRSAAQQNLLSIYIQRSRTRPLSITIRNNRFVYDLKYSRQLPFTPEHIRPATRQRMPMGSTGYYGMPCPATPYVPPPLFPSLQRNGHTEESQTHAQ